MVRSDGRQEGARRQRAVDVQHSHHGTVRQVRSPVRIVNREGVRLKPL
jgi:hypothetical protein